MPLRSLALRPSAAPHARGLRYNAVVVFETAMQFVFKLPRFSWLNILKAGFLKAAGAKIGRNPVFYPNAWIMTGKNLRIGDDVDISMGVIITTSGGVTIGNRCLIGYRSQIFSANHKIDTTVPVRFSGHEDAPVTIGDDVWICANCLILPGSSIGNGTVIAAGSVVNGDIPGNVVAAGVPATVVSQRRNEEQQ